MSGMQMAQATIDSVPMEFTVTMPAATFPRVCGRDCSHLRCNQWRQQFEMPCSECGELIRTGERLIERRHKVTKALLSQRHADACPVERVS
jgi:hypothetical protein